VIRTTASSEGKGAEIIDILAILQKSLKAAAKPAAKR